MYTVSSKDRFYYHYRCQNTKPREDIFDNYKTYIIRIQIVKQMDKQNENKFNGI